MEQLINKLPQMWEDRIIPLMTVNDKFILGGSVALHILKIMDYNFDKRTPDLDFSLIEPFEEKEFLTLLDFFNLSVMKGNNDYNIDGDLILNLDPTLSLEKELILLESNVVIDFDETNWKDKYYRVDFFNHSYLKKKDWFELDYFGTILKITHPSVILSAKMLYATDNRVGKQHKHFQDIKSIDWKEYFKIVKRIQPHHKEAKNKNGSIKYVLDKYVFETTPIPNYHDVDELPF
jgi:hypothetical protein